ncbi:hypothetical protein DXG03_002166 [Asterophora parasitica]|uniref:Chromatin modification-related protein EAF3 n=1 Tax=Asterophora parasitica TaxID=117018 RepID=A0A9P7GC06_9AGAR|nr:hypothetical protein DXG03_002166 [Asterophora parasitica]
MSTSTPAAAANPTAITFTPNERVLCYHGPLIYEAKVLKIDTFTDATTLTGDVGPHCFVHYKGWKQTWDEWVPHTRLLKHNEGNLELQKALKRSNAPPPAAGASSSRGPKVGTKEASGSARAGARKDGGTRGTKRGREEDESSKKPEMKLNLPEVLKGVLVDDWEAVSKNHQLVTLPRSPTVVQLLDEFADYVVEKKPPHLRDPALLIKSIVSGLTLYFDRSLGANLLYRFERPQFAEIRKAYKTGQQVVVGVTEKEMSEVYGAEHLLRMLVSLPGMIANSSLDSESVALVRDYVNELLEYVPSLPTLYI